MSVARRKRQPDRHLVHGVWMTEAEAAEQLHRSRRTVRDWRYSHRRAGGGPALLEEAWDHYADVNAGRIKLHAGRPPVYRLRGRPTTIPEAAAKLGIRKNTLYTRLYYHRCSLDEAVRYYEQKRLRQAEKRILEIIDGARR